MDCATVDAIVLAAPAITPQFLIGLLVRAPLIFLALTVHEFFHAYSADKMGDPTGRNQGRLTLNPMAHLDPIGTICLFVGPLGWARPVPINPINFANPARGMFISAAAGPLSNLGLALIAGLLLRLTAALGWDESRALAAAESDAAGFSVWASAALVMFLQMNIGLFLFNLIPLYPLDGHHIVRESLRGEARQRYEETQHLGSYVLLALILLPALLNTSSILWTFLGPPAERLMRLFAGESGLDAGRLCLRLLSPYF